ncbi:MAG: hypothetical protein UV55_C0023G0011 [Candidatus Gottesmanbacteria bacterium GW2011_GWC1_43_10]|nr:MAG: hypothetical protein UV55_C0023G0011 [Candidatus Gottesmanbacteria bacterium GW2011_GWC1_43_10]
MAKKLEWRTVRRRVRDLVDFAGNPQEQNDWSLPTLIKSLKKYNIVETPVIDTDGTLLAGHGRKKALVEMGRADEEIDVRMPSRPLTKKEREGYLLISNSVHGSFSPDLLRGFDTELLLNVIDPDTLARLWDDHLEIEGDDFDEEKEKAKIKTPTVKPGDFLQLGAHTLGCFDSTDEKLVRKLVGDTRIDFVDVDGPFNIKWSYKGKNNKYGGSEKDDKTPDEYRAFMKALIQNSIAVSKPDAHYLFWCDERWVWLLQTLYQELGIISERLCIWAKNNSMPTPKIAFNKATEFAVYGRRGTPYINDKVKNLTTILNKEVGSGNRSIEDIIDLFNIWLVSRIPGNEMQHPTQKPPELYEKALRRCTKVGDTVLDLCAGSGSLMVGCEQMKRRAFLAERDPIFATLIKNRYELLTGNKARKLN